MARHLSLAHVGKHDDLTRPKPIVPITTLDTAINDNQVRLIKVDVEGFEPEVIKGATRLLNQSGPMALIIELIGLAGHELGMSDDSVHAMITDYGFTPFRYSPLTRELSELNGINRNDNNTLYLKEPEKIRERLASAPSFMVLGRSI